MLTFNFKNFENDFEINVEFFEINIEFFEFNVEFFEINIESFKNQNKVTWSGNNDSFHWYKLAFLDFIFNG